MYDAHPAIDKAAVSRKDRSKIGVSTIATVGTSAKTEKKIGFERNDANMVSPNNQTKADGFIVVIVGRSDWFL